MPPFWVWKIVTGAVPCRAVGKVRLIARRISDVYFVVRVQKKKALRFRLASTVVSQADAFFWLLGEPWSGVS